MGKIKPISRNEKGRIISVNGFPVLEYVWRRVVEYVHDFDANNTVNFELSDEQVVNEIVNQLEVLATEGEPDPVLCLFFEQFDEEAVYMLISYGQAKEWSAPF